MWTKEKLCLLTSENVLCKSQSRELENLRRHWKKIIRKILKEVILGFVWFITWESFGAKCCLVNRSRDWFWFGQTKGKVLTLEPTDYGSGHAINLHSFLHQMGRYLHLRAVSINGESYIMCDVWQVVSTNYNCYISIIQKSSRAFSSLGVLGKLCLNLISWFFSLKSFPKPLLLLFFSLSGSTTSQMLNSTPKHPRYKCQPLHQFAGKTSNGTVWFELLNFLTTWEVVRKVYSTMKSKAFQVLLASSEPYSPPILCQSHRSLLSPSAHSLDSIPSALNSCYTKCGPRVPAALDLPESSLEMQITGLSRPDLLNQNLHWMDP